MKKLIEVHDDWCEVELFNYLENFFLNDSKVPYFYNDNLTVSPKNSKNRYKPGFSLGIYPQQKGSYVTNFTSQIAKRFCDYRKVKLKKIHFIRSFISLPSGTKSTKDIIHVDLKFPHHVLLYYLRDSEGYTYLFEDDEKTIIKKIKPKKGRVVFFDGSIKHCSSTPIETTRAVINFDLSVDL